MRIVSREELLTLPAGLLIAELDQYGNASEFRIFGGKYADNDFLIRTITDPQADSGDDSYNKRKDMRVNGTSYPVNEDYGREGLFEEDQHFLIYEPADIASIMRELNTGSVGEQP